MSFSYPLDLSSMPACHLFPSGCDRNIHMMCGGDGWSGLRWNRSYSSFLSVKAEPRNVELMQFRSTRRATNGPTDGRHIALLPSFLLHQKATPSLPSTSPMLLLHSGGGDKSTTSDSEQRGIRERDWGIRRSPGYVVLGKDLKFSLFRQWETYVSVI